MSENFRSADHLLPFGFDKGQWRLIRTYGGHWATALVLPLAPNWALRIVLWYAAWAMVQ